MLSGKDSRSPRRRQVDFRTRLLRLCDHLDEHDEVALTSHLRWFLALRDAERARWLRNIHKLEQRLGDPSRVKAELIKEAHARYERLATDPSERQRIAREAAERLRHRITDPALVAEGVRRVLAALEPSEEDLEQRVSVVVDVLRCGRLLEEAWREWDGRRDEDDAPVGAAAAKAAEAVEELAGLYAISAPTAEAVRAFAEIAYTLHMMSLDPGTPDHQVRLVGGVPVGPGVVVERRDLCHDAIVSAAESGSRIRQNYILSGSMRAFVAYIIAVIERRSTDALRREQRQAGHVRSRTKDESPEALREGTGRWSRTEAPDPLDAGNVEKSADNAPGDLLDAILPREVEQQWLEREMRQAVWKALIARHSVSSTTREILSLWLVEGKSDAEIAEALGYARETVNRARRRWIREVREALAEPRRLLDHLEDPG